MRERKAVRKGLVFGIVFLMLTVVFIGMVENIGGEGVPRPNPSAEK